MRLIILIFSIFLLSSYSYAEEIETLKQSTQVVDEEIGAQEDDQQDCVKKLLAKCEKKCEKFYIPKQCIELCKKNIKDECKYADE